MVMFTTVSTLWQSGQQIINPGSVACPILLVGGDAVPSMPSKVKDGGVVFLFRKKFPDYEAELNCKSKGDSFYQKCMKNLRRDDSLYEQSKTLS